jgi:cytochrome c556
MLTSTAFLVDQWKMMGPSDVAAIGKPVLVIAPYLTNTLDHRSYLIVRGELLKFDTAALARVASEYKLDLGPELWEMFQGQPMLLAASVISSTYAELSKKPIRPPTANELALSDAMKTITPAFAALKTAVEGSNAADVAKNAAQLKPAFARTEKIWDDVGQSSAGQWARDAQEFIASIEHSAAQGDWDRVKFAAGKLNALCGSCHTTFRDRAEDGTFRMKAGTF